MGLQGHNGMRGILYLNVKCAVCCRRTIPHVCEMSWHMAYTDIPVFIVIAPHAAGDDNQPDQLWMEIMQNQVCLVL